MTITDSRPAVVAPKPMGDTPGGHQLAGGHISRDTQADPAAGPDSRPTVPAAQPIGHSSGGEQLTDPPMRLDARSAGAVGASSRSAMGVSTPIGPAPSGPEPTDRRTGTDDHRVFAVEAKGDPAAEVRPMPNSASLLDPALALAADVLDDIERVRIANANRLQILTRSEEDSDGEVRGFGLDESHPDVARLAAMVEMLGKVEHDAELNLGRMLRRHPLHAWIKAQRGIGDKQGARLLAAIGDPYINGSTGQPRTVSALWAFCGLHVLLASPGVRDPHHPAAGGPGGDPGLASIGTQDTNAGVAPKRARGQRANWSTRAKTKAYLVAMSCMKQLVKPCARDGDGPAVHVDGCVCSPYRVVYDRRRAHTAVTRPDWSDGHSHSDAVRVAAKAILRDLWRAAKEHHCGPEDTGP